MEHIGTILMGILVVLVAMIAYLVIKIKKENEIAQERLHDTIVRMMNNLSAKIEEGSVKRTNNTNDGINTLKAQIESSATEMARITNESVGIIKEQLSSSVTEIAKEIRDADKHITDTLNTVIHLD